MKDRIRFGILKFMREEALWLDSLVRKIYPRWLTIIAERGRPVFFAKFLRYVLARFSGLSIERNQDTHMLTGKGYRDKQNPPYIIQKVRCRAMKRGKEIAKKDFEMNLLVDEDISNVNYDQLYVGN